MSEMSERLAKEIRAKMGDFNDDNQPVAVLVRDLKTRADELLISLQNLVSLKDYKESHGKDAFYLRQQPIVWEEARKKLMDK